jgi:isoquinoline 1-oxidoreductase beta subunit
LTLQVLKAGLDAAGRVIGWEHVLASTSWTGRIGTLGGFRVVIDSAGRDPRSFRGGDHYYEIPDQLLRWIHREPGIPTGPYRSVELNYTGFATESFLDELAHLAKVDPLQLRLGMLSKQPRLANVLRIAAVRAGWGTPTPPDTGRGLAIAPAWRVSQSWVAAVVQARVDRASGEVRVEKITCAVDCGIVVSPDGLRAQVEGGLLFGVSAALKERASLTNGAYDQKNFEDYPILRMDEIPEVEIHVVESTEPPTGVGEPGTPVIPPALANAIFAATGARVRSLPFLPERVRGALAAR